MSTKLKLFTHIIYNFEVIHMHYQLFWSYLYTLSTIFFFFFLRCSFEGIWGINLNWGTRFRWVPRILRSIIEDILLAEIIAKTVTLHNFLILGLKRALLTLNTIGWLMLLCYSNFCANNKNVQKLVSKVKKIRRIRIKITQWHSPNVTS